MVTAHETGCAGEIETADTGAVSPVEVHRAIAADNPLGKLPTLVTDHGRALYDSRVICEYLCHHSGNKELLPDEPVSRFRILTLQALGVGTCDAAVALRYETWARPEALQWPDWAARQKARIDAALDEANSNRDGGLDEVTVGSIAIACALGYLDFRFPDHSWRVSRPTLQAFYERFSARPSMQATPHPA